MLDVITTALEVVAVVLVVAAVGWVVWLLTVPPFNGPAGFAAAGAAAWGASWGLSAAHDRAVRRLAVQAGSRERVVR